MTKNYSKIWWNTLALLLVFGISIGFGYLVYYSIGNNVRVVSNNKNKNKITKYNNNQNNKKDIPKHINDVKKLNNNSDEVIKEIEKFSDLKILNNTDNTTGNFTLDLENNKNHLEYNSYFIENPLDCIKDKVLLQKDTNDYNRQNNMIKYDDVLKGYIESINLDLIQFLQKSYKDAHLMNSERQVDLHNIDSLPGKFM